MDITDVGAVQAAIESTAVTEVTRCHKLSGLGLGLGDIAGIHGAITSRVADQHAHRNAHVVRICAIAYAEKCDRYPLRVADISQRHDHYGFGLVTSTNPPVRRTAV